MAFDWPSFFDLYSIPWFKATRTNITIKCPMCGDDPSHHLSVSLQDKGWHCWRNDAHSGRSARDLVMVLLGCSTDQAARIVSEQEQAAKLLDEGFASSISQLLGKAKPLPVTTRPLELLPEFIDMLTGFSQRLFVPYLTDRGYSDNDLEWLVKRFKLRSALTGQFAYRIIIPVYVSGRLVTWTARTITGDRLRYKTLSTDSETAAKSDLPVAAISIKETLFDYDALRKGGEILVITEGPFDAMRVSFFGDDAIRGTCLFGKTISDGQRELIGALRPLYHQVVLLSDTDVRWSMFGKLPDWVTIRRLPPSVEDPAKLNYTQFCRLFE